MCDAVDTLLSVMPLMPQLTCLIVDIHAPGRSELDRFADVHHALSAASGLEYLDIRGHIFMPTESRPLASEEIEYKPLEFPHMQELRVVVPLDGISVFMDMIVVPDTCMIEAGCYIDDQGAMDVRALRKLAQTL